MNFRDIIRGPIFLEEMQATKHGPRTKKVKVPVDEFDGVVVVAADSDSESEPNNIAESDADTDAAIGHYGNLYR